MNKRKEYNGGEWTEARFNSFVKSALRSASKRWPVKYQTLAGAYSGQRVNPRTGRLGKHYRCARCSGHFPAKEVQVDHIRPIIDPKVGFVSWDEVVNNMFCEADNLQCLCVTCHKIKTAEERQLAKEYKKNG